jgi:hypothetical protein
VRISLAALHGKISLSLRGLSDKRPNEGSRPVSIVVDEPMAPRQARPVLSVKIHDPESNTAELRQYDTTGRRLEAPKN